MILDEIKSKLEELDPNIFYGMVDDIENNMRWDYIVFNRTGLKSSLNKTSYTDGYDVHIVRENFIPEGIDIQVINKILEISGMRLADEDGTYNYALKPNTNHVVEMLTLHFVRARK